MAKSPRLLVQHGQGATHGHTCPQCLRNVANVAQSREFGGYVPIEHDSAEILRAHETGRLKESDGAIMVNQKTGQRKHAPDNTKSANWILYGEGDGRFYFKDADGVPCNGDWGKHYHHHGASFLWLRVESEMSPEVGQMRLI